MATLLVLVLILSIALSNSADPDPLQDYCVPSQNLHPECKTSASSADFVSELLRGAANSQAPKTWNATLLSAATFPGLNTMALSLARADLGVGGTVPLHIHPRASELIYILDGLVEAGFVDSNNVLFSQTLHAGDVMIVPKGMFHYQYNAGSSRATVLASFDSQNPGVVVAGPGLFGSGIRDEVLAASLGGIDASTVESLKGKFKPRS